jgi:hypothetical protein
MSVLNTLIQKIDDLLPALEAFAKATPSKTDDYAIGLLRMALGLIRHRAEKADTGN